MAAQPPAAGNSARSLDQAIQQTAQEIQNLLLAFTATAFVPGTVVRIVHGLSPPSQLSINRATRPQAAQAYYANTIFELPGNLDRFLLLQWVRNIPPAHRPYIRNIHMAMAPVNSAWFSGPGRRHFELSTICHAVEQVNLWPNPVAFPRHLFEDQSVLKVRETVQSEDGEGQVWKWVGLIELTAMMNAALVRIN